MISAPGFRYSIKENGPNTIITAARRKSAGSPVMHNPEAVERVATVEREILGNKHIKKALTLAADKILHQIVYSVLEQYYPNKWVKYNWENQKKSSKLYFRTLNEEGKDDFLIKVSKFLESGELYSIVEAGIIEMLKGMYAGGREKTQTAKQADMWRYILAQAIVSFMKDQANFLLKEEIDWENQSSFMRLASHFDMISYFISPRVRGSDIDPYVRKWARDAGSLGKEVTGSKKELSGMKFSIEKGDFVLLPGLEDMILEALASRNINVSNEKGVLSIIDALIGTKDSKTFYLNMRDIKLGTCAAYIDYRVGGYVSKAVIVTVKVSVAGSPMQAKEGISAGSALQPILSWYKDLKFPDTEHSIVTYANYYTAQESEGKEIHSLLDMPWGLEEFSNNLIKEFKKRYPITGEAKKVDSVTLKLQINTPPETRDIDVKQIAQKIKDAIEEEVKKGTFAGSPMQSEAEVLKKAKNSLFVKIESLDPDLRIKDSLFPELSGKLAAVKTLEGLKAFLSDLTSNVDNLIADKEKTVAYYEKYYPNNGLTIQVKADLGVLRLFKNVIADVSNELPKEESVNPAAQAKQAKGDSSAESPMSQLEEAKQELDSAIVKAISAAQTDNIWRPGLERHRIDTLSIPAAKITRLHLVKGFSFLVKAFNLKHEEEVELCNWVAEELSKGINIQIFGEEIHTGQVFVNETQRNLLARPASIEVTQSTIASPALQAQKTVSSPMKTGSIDASLRSASIPDNKGMGGIDFRTLPMTIKPMGSFEGLNLQLPRLSSSALLSFNLDEEIRQLNQMISGGIIPSGARLQELVAAAWQKGKLQDYQSEILTLLAEICKLQEGECCESSDELKVALIAANAV